VLKLLGSSEGSDSPGRSSFASTPARSVLSRLRQVAPFDLGGIRLVQTEAGANVRELRGQYGLGSSDVPVYELLPTGRDRMRRLARCGTLRHLVLDRPLDLTAHAGPVQCSVDECVRLDLRFRKIRDRSGVGFKATSPLHRHFVAAGPCHADDDSSTKNRRLVMSQGASWELDLGTRRLYQSGDERVTGKWHDHGRIRIPVSVKLVAV
jgi:hypothetical protein